MRALKSIIIGAVVGLLSLACAAGPSPTGPEAAGAGAGEAALQPKRGGVLQYAPAKVSETLHPHIGGTSAIVKQVGPAYETLVSFLYEPGKDYKETFKVVPWLAESWEQPDELTYIFRIRKGIKWHDGVDFTAADPAFTFNWWRQEKLAASGRVAQAATFEVVDPYTLKIRMKAPAPDFLMELADKNAFIVAKHAVEGGVDLNKVVMGTGPFKLKSFQSGVESLWERNNDYWQPGRPYMDGVHQIWGLEESAMWAAFIAGENDLFPSSDLGVLDTVQRARPQAKLYPTVSDTGNGMLMKLDRPPFNDVRVRRAVHLALDRKSMHVTYMPSVPLERAQYVTPGVWAGRQGFAIPQEELQKLPGYRTPKDQDIAEAKRLLAEAGYPEGLKFDLIYDVGIPGSARRGEMMPGLLRPAGISVILKPLESSAWADADDKGQYEGGNMASLVNASFRGLYERFHSMGASNKVGLKDPKLDALIEATLTGKDEEARKRAARQMQGYFLEQAYYIPLIEWEAGALTQPWVYDFVMSANSALNLSQDVYPQMWLDVDAMPASRR